MSGAGPNVNRLAVKLFAKGSDGVDLHAFIPLFHRFVQEASVPGILIDVADYAHMPDGPGILLVGHDVDYGIDLSGNRLGLLTTVKRWEGSLAAALEDALTKTLAMIQAIEAAEPESNTGLVLDTSAIEVRVLDRLAVANDDAGYATLEAAATPIFASLFGDAKHELDRIGAPGPRSPLTLTAVSQRADKVADLASRLSSGAGVAATASAPAGAGYRSSLSPEDADRQSDWDLSVEDLKALRESGASFTLVDVREPHEYEICHLDGKLIPLGQLAERVGELDKREHIVVHCRSGPRSAQAVVAMRNAGFENAWNVRGGILAWIDRVDSSLTPY